MKRGTGSSVVRWRRKGKASWKRQRGLSIEKDLPMGGHSRQHCEKRQAGKLRDAGCDVEAGAGGEWALGKEEVRDEIDNPGEVFSGPIIGSLIWSIRK